MADEINIHAGCLFKRGNITKSWKSRYFALTDQFSLKYFESLKKATESEMKCNNKNVLGTIELSDIQSIQVALIGNNKNNKIPKYVTILKEYKIDKNERSFIIHLCEKKRTHVISADNFSSFMNWLQLFYRYIYGGILYESYGWKQGERNKAFKYRYFVLNKYKQIKYYNNDQREIQYGIININTVHSFNIDDIDNPASPNDNIIQLNTPKRIWNISYPTEVIWNGWCKEFAKIGLVTSKKWGKQFIKTDAIFKIRMDYEADKLLPAQFVNVRSNTVTSNTKGGFNAHYHDKYVVKVTQNKKDNEYKDEGKEEDTMTGEEHTIIKKHTITITRTRGKTFTPGNDEIDDEYLIEFKIIVDGIGLYKEVTLETEVFGIDMVKKDAIMNGKYMSSKIVKLENGLFCSKMDVEEMGYTTYKVLLSPSVTVKQLQQTSGNDDDESEYRTQRLLSDLSI